jgi:hypothetical protein
MPKKSENQVLPLFYKELGASKNPSASRADLIHWFRGRIGCVRWNYSGFRLS